MLNPDGWGLDRDPLASGKGLEPLPRGGAEAVRCRGTVKKPGHRVSDVRVDALYQFQLLARADVGVAAQHPTHQQSDFVSVGVEVEAGLG